MAVTVGSGEDYEDLAAYLAALKAATETDYAATVIGATATFPADWDYSANPVVITANTLANGQPGVGCLISSETAGANIVVASGNADVKLVGFRVAIPQNGSGYNAIAVDEASTRLRLVRCRFERDTNSNGNGGLLGVNTGAQIICDDCWFASHQDSIYVGFGAFNPGAGRIIARNCKVLTDHTGAAFGAFFKGEGDAKVQYENLVAVHLTDDDLFGAVANVEALNDGNLVTTVDGTVLLAPANNVEYLDEDIADVLKSSATVLTADMRWPTRALAVARPGADLSANNAVGIDGKTRTSAEDKTIIGGDIPSPVPVIDEEGSGLPDLPDANQNSPYGHFIVATSNEAITWSLIGAAPAGLSVSNVDLGNGTHLGVLDGPVTDTPDAYTFTIRATNSGGFDDATANLTVNEQGKFEFDAGHYDLGSTPAGTPGTAVEVTLANVMGGTVEEDVKVFFLGGSGIEYSLVGPNGPWITPGAAVTFSPSGGTLDAHLWLRIAGSAEVADMVLFAQGQTTMDSVSAVVTGALTAAEITMQVRLTDGNGAVVGIDDILNLGSAAIGANGQWVTVYIENVGSVALTLGVPELTGAGDFELDTAGFDTSLDPTDTTTFKVRFAPTGVVGAKSAGVEWTHDDAEVASPFTLGLAATAVAPAADDDDSLSLGLGLGL